jgi:signal transduction histidine kinase
MNNLPSESNIVIHSNFVILLVEDEPATRLIISKILQRDGYKVIEAATGEDAIKLYQKYLPDIVLLDAVLPGIDGFETCHLINKLPKALVAPVLMVTTLEDSASVDKAFEVGAIDFITKPIQWPILRNRVKRILASRQMEKMKEDLTNMIVHDLKAPLLAINGYMELLIDKTWGELNTQQFRAVERTYHNTRRLLDLSTMILDLSRLEEGKFSLQLSSINIPGILQKASENMEWMAQTYGVEIQLTCPETEIFLKLDENLLYRVLINLLSNAVKHSFSGSNILLGCEHVAKGEFRVSVTDNGEGISMEDQPFIFDKFRQGARRRGGSSTDSGLGLTFCKLAVEAMGGKIDFRSVPGKGTTFTVSFPLSG